MEQTTIPRMVFERVTRHPDRLAVSFRRGGVWRDVSWVEYGRAVREIALGLDKLGIAAGERTAIISNTRVEWHFVDLGTQCLAAIAVGIYPTLLAEDMAYILNDCQARVAFCENWSQLEKVRQIWPRLPELKYAVLFEPSQGGEVDERVLSLESLRARGAEAEASAPGRFAELLERGRPEDLFTIIYTSGTTGPPKGAMITHSNALAVCRAIEEQNIVSESDTAIEYLPLAHAYERIGGMLAALYCDAAQGIAESFDTLREDIAFVRPTVMVGVPRVFEKLYDGIVSSAREAGPVKRALFEWALAAGREALPYRVKKLPLPFQLRMRYALAERLVFSKLAERLGGRMRFALSAAAPLAPEIIEFFFSLGITLLQGYGMTECSAPSTITTPDDPAIGTVGKPLSCNEVRLAPDGEVLIRGANVFKGYWNQPKATAEALDAEGWLHSGDVGEIDVDGNLKITDRKKNLIITAGGKNIAPQNLENAIKQQPYISEALVYGDRRPYLVALLTVDEERVRRFAAESGIAGQEISELLARPEVKLLIDRCVEQANAGLARFEQIKRFSVLPTQFSIEDGTITPTMKLKRKEIITRYAGLIDELYN